MHEAGGASVLAFGHQRCTQHGQGLAIAGAGLQVGFQRVDGQVVIAAFEVDLRQRFGNRGVGLGFDKNFKILLGFFRAVQAVMGQAVEHQNLGLVADEIQRNLIQQVGQFTQSRLRVLRAALTLCRQRPQVDPQRMVG